MPQAALWRAPPLPLRRATLRPVTFAAGVMAGGAAAVVPVRSHMWGVANSLLPVCTLVQCRARNAPSTPQPRAPGTRALLLTRASLACERLDAP